MSENSKSNCYQCAYRGSVPGSAHSRCTFNFAGQGVPLPTGHPHGIRSGWWMFPFNYDPTWLVGICQGFGTERDPEKVSASGNDPLMELFGFLGGRR